MKRLLPVTIIAAAIVVAGTAGVSSSRFPCAEDEVHATFRAGPGRTSGLCIHYEELSPAADARVSAEAVAWKTHR